MTISKIQIGAHYHRSLVEATVVGLNLETLKVEMDLVSVDPNKVKELMGRVRMNKTPNLTVEALLVHKTPHNDAFAAYRVTTNRYGITVVPWSLVNREDLRKDGDILAFQTCDENRMLTISRDKAIVSACFQFEEDGAYVYDQLVPEDKTTGISTAVLDGVFYMFVSDRDYDLVLTFPELEDIEPEDILHTFTLNRTFTL